jgi:hypothetical protein
MLKKIFLLILLFLSFFIFFKKDVLSNCSCACEHSINTDPGCPPNRANGTDNVDCRYEERCWNTCGGWDSCDVCDVQRVCYWTGCSCGSSGGGGGGSQPPTPTPTLYPTVAIFGNLREYLGVSCFDNISTSNISLNINPQYSAGITSACGITPPTGQTKYSYSCTVVFDNQGARPTPIQNLSLSASAYGYSFGYWSDPNNTCTANYNNVLTVDVSLSRSKVYNKDIYFSLTTPWIKLKDSSFSKIGSLTNIVPLNIIAYDTDDNANRYFIINSSSPPQTDPGLVSAASINTGTANVSSKNWWVTSYSRIVSTSPQLFLDYVRSRKEYQTIADLSSITKNGLYVWQGDLTLTNTNLNNQITASNLVLIVNGNLSINENQFNIGSDCRNTSTSKKIALLSTGAINFSNTTQCAAGIFIGQTIDTGSNYNQGLKIKGNLVGFSSFNNQRKWSDNSKPSVFIVFQPQMYLDLLPYLSVSKYDWQQLQ